MELPSLVGCPLRAAFWILAGRVALATFLCAFFVPDVLETVLCSLPWLCAVTLVAMRPERRVVPAILLVSECWKRMRVRVFKVRVVRGTD